MTATVRKLDNWKVWVGVAYFGLAATVVWLFFLNQSNSRTQSRQDKDEAIRVAELEASTNAQRSQCLSSIPTLKKINGFVAGVYELHSTLEQNSKATLDATPKTDPAWRVRHDNWVRIRRTVAKVAGVHFPVPTKAECKAIGKP